MAALPQDTINIDTQILTLDGFTLWSVHLCEKTAERIILDGMVDSFGIPNFWTLPE